MALSPEEREKIIEVETLKFETRKNMQSGNCHRSRCGGMRWLWFLAFFILGYAIHGLCDRMCPWHQSSCAWQGMGPGMGMASGGHCMFGHGMMPPDGQEGTGAPGPVSPDAALSPATKP